MKVMQSNRKSEEIGVNGKTVVQETKKNSEKSLLENHETLRKVTFELDSNTGSIAINVDTLKNMNIELGQIAENVRNTDLSNLTDMGMMFYDIDHKIMLLADLLHYTVKELEENLKHTQIIKESYYDLIIRTKEQESNPNDASSHEYPFTSMECL